MQSYLVPIEWAFVGGPATGAVSGLGDDGSRVAVGEELLVIFQAGHCRLATLPRAEKVQEFVAGNAWGVCPPTPSHPDIGMGIGQRIFFARHVRGPGRYRDGR